MANWHGYFGIENLELNEDQRETLVQVLRNLGEANDGDLPHLINQWHMLSQWPFIFLLEKGA